MKFIGSLKCFFCINMQFAGLKVVTSAQILLGNDMSCLQGIMCVVVEFVMELECCQCHKPGQFGLYSIAERKGKLTFKNRASYIYRTGIPLPSKCCILYIFSTNISTEYFKHAAHYPFFSSKCRLFHNATFGSCVIHILLTGCAKI